MPLYEVKIELGDVKEFTDPFELLNPVIFALQTREKYPT